MAEIPAKVVKELRDRTGAGMMDCKKALQENSGEIEKAVEWLRQKGLASAGKKAGRVAAEGLVDSYIHTGGRIGVLVEVNCETDFVARNQAFVELVRNIAMQMLGYELRSLFHSLLPPAHQCDHQYECNCETDFVARNQAFVELVRNIAMQIAACPNVEYVKVSDIPAEIADKEKAIEMGKDDLAGKPENIKEKIVSGRIDKRLKEMSLVDQPYIKDQSMTVEELVKQSVAQLGENIQIRRFARFVLGEGIEKSPEES